jgi:hypothetical protein
MDIEDGSDEDDDEEEEEEEDADGTIAVSPRGYSGRIW